MTPLLFLALARAGEHPPVPPGELPPVPASEAPSGVAGEAPQGAPVPPHAGGSTIDGYMNDLRMAVNPRWKERLELMTAEIPGGTYATTVDVTLDADGVLVTVVVSHPSGREGFDQCVVDAFWLASPFEPPPPELLVGTRFVPPPFDFVVIADRRR